MKKLKLTLLNLGGAEVLTREQLKSIIGGNGGSGPGGKGCSVTCGPGYFACCNEGHVIIGPPVQVIPPSCLCKSTSGGGTSCGSGGTGSTSCSVNSD